MEISGLPFDYCEMASILNRAVGVTVMVDGSRYSAWVERLWPSHKYGVRASKKMRYFLKLSDDVRMSAVLKKSVFDRDFGGCPITSAIPPCLDCGVVFDSDVVIPVLQMKQFDTGEWVTWMSAVPFEIVTQGWMILEAIKVAEKRNEPITVGIGGIGMGWFATAIIETLGKSVEKVVLVDSSRVIIDSFGHDLFKRHQNVRLEMVQSDAYSFDWSDCDIVLFDVWAGYGESMGDLQYKSLKDDLARDGIVLFGWGDDFHEIESRAKERNCNG